MTVFVYYFEFLELEACRNEWITNTNQSTNLHDVSDAIYGRGQGD